MPFKDSAQAARCAHEGWAKCPDRDARTRPGREAALAKLMSEVDPDGVMSERDRRRAAKNRQKANMLKLAEQGRAAQKAKAEARRKAKQAGE